jgi:hypothetical protein
MGLYLLTEDPMGQTTLSILWVGSFKATTTEATDFREAVAKIAKQLDLEHLLSEVFFSSNGLTQFTLMPTGSTEGWPESNNWESLGLSIARMSAGTDFFIKRLYVAAN